MEFIKTKENALEHHGILGMHWGIRRFQNKDGTLTPAGRKRYDEDYTTKAEGNTLSKNSKSSGKKVAIGIGVGIGVAAITAGAVYAAKKSGIKLSDLKLGDDFGKNFVESASKEFSNIESGIKKSTEMANNRNDLHEVANTLSDTMKGINFNMRSSRAYGADEYFKNEKKIREAERYGVALRSTLKELGVDYRNVGLNAQDVGTISQFFERMGIKF